MFIYLQHLCDALTNFFKDFFNIAGYGLRLWKSVLRPASLHEASKSTVGHNLEWPLVLSHPTNDLGSVGHGILV